MTHRFFVISVDEAEIPRVIYRSVDESRCHIEADHYWENLAEEGEAVLVTCEHDKIVGAALGHSVN